MFLDRWKPPAFLTVPPNPVAREDIKQGLVAKYGYYLKAWRRAMDPRSQNRCNWRDFQIGCAKIGFVGDIAGAWRALDYNMSGDITLFEIDPLSCETLRSFKLWADEQFGSVRSTFSVFDEDGSNSVTGREFRRAARIY